MGANVRIKCMICLIKINAIVTGVILFDVTDSQSIPIYW